MNRQSQVGIGKKLSPGVMPGVMAVLLPMLAATAGATPCEDMAEFQRTQEEVKAAEQTIAALQRSRPAGHWAAVQDQLQKARETEQQAKAKYDKALAAKKIADAEVDTYLAVSGWLLSPVGTTDEADYLRQGQSVAMPNALGAQFRRAQGLRREISALDREIAQAETLIRNADKKQQQAMVDYERQQIMPMETSLRNRLPGVPLEEAGTTIADPKYNGFKTPELDELWRQYEEAGGNQTTMFNAAEDNQNTLRELGRKLKDAIEAQRATVQADLDELDARRTTLRGMQQQTYGGEAGYEQVVALRDNRRRKAEKENELATLRTALLGEHQDALRRSDAADARVLAAQHERQDAGKKITQLEAELKAWRQAEKERYLAQRRLERQRVVADDALREEATALSRAVAIIKEPLADYKQNSPANYEAELQQLREQHKQIVTQARATRDALQKQIDGLKARRVYTEQDKARIFGQWSRHLTAAREKDGQVKKRYAEIKQFQQQQPQQQRQRQQRLLSALRQARSELSPFNCESFPDAQQSVETIQDRISELEEKLRGSTASPLAGTALLAGFMALPELYSPATDAERTTRVVKAPAKPAPSATPKERTFNVTAGQWHSTGITLKKGQGFDVRATGKLIGSDGFEVGPAGGGYWRWWILHGKIGDKMWPIGTGGYERAPADGQLELGIPQVGGKFGEHDHGFKGAYIVKIYGVR